jgi:serine/alanine adding enzyme
MKIISDINLIDKQKWSAFMLAHPDGNIFQTPQMYEVYEQTKKYKPVVVAAVGNDGELLGILLAVIQKEYSGLLGRFTARSIIFGGPVVGGDNAAVLDSILSYYLKIVKSKAIYSQVRNFKALNESLKVVFEKNGLLFEDHLNILISTDIEEKELWKNVKRSRKDGINKAGKQDFEFKYSEKLSEVSNFYNLFIQLYQKINLPYPDISFFKGIDKLLFGNAKWFSLNHNGEPIIILCALEYNSTLYIFSIGISQDDNLRRLRPVDLFYWEVLRWCSENGIKSFDWMGAGKPDQEYGVRKFKLQYGGELYNFGRFEMIHKKNLFKMGKFGLKFWRKVK